jgi:hypothetical protein
VHVDVIGTHNDATAQRILPVAIEWLGQRMKAYGVICEVRSGDDAMVPPASAQPESTGSNQATSETSDQAGQAVPRLPEPEQLTPTPSVPAPTKAAPSGSRSGRWYRNTPK